MTTSFTNRFRPSIDALEHREAPSSSAISPPKCGDTEAPLLIAARAAESSAANSHARPFHLEDSGSAVINFSGGTVSASATGKATHLGKFTLHDTSRIVGFDGVVLSVAAAGTEQERADLEAANGDHLYASFSGSVSLATGTGTLNFEWVGGTGRFANATGSTVWHITLNEGEGLTYTAVADGEISY